MSNFKPNPEFIERKISKSIYSTQNSVYLTGQVTCETNRIKNLLNLQCTIATTSYVDFCLECPSLILTTLVNQKVLSFENVALAQKYRLNKMYKGGLFCDGVNYFSLCVQISYFEKNEKEFILSPLKNLHKIKTKYTDDIQTLAFAFASVLKHLLGNVTTKPGPHDAKFYEIRVLYFLERNIILKETLYDNRNSALGVEHKFGSLRFVSCGSRGLGNLQIKQFVAVFETYVWKWLLVFALILLVNMNLLKGSLCSLKLLEKLICLIKVLVEQGDPFPGRFIKLVSFRFLICGSLLGGLVLSNAFKSNNVYNIVLPKQPLKFSTIDELLQHGHKIHSKLTKIYFNLYDLEILLPSTYEVFIKNSIFGNSLEIHDTEGHKIFSSETEIETLYSIVHFSPHKLAEKDLSSLLFLKNVTVPHLGLRDVILEPLKILSPLLQLGLLDTDTVENTAANSADFWKKQENFIENDLKQCNKSAWILPNYRAQQLTRKLHQAERHSDVGFMEYFKPWFNIKFGNSVFSSIIRKSSMVSSSGLLKWWSDLINRTDLKFERQNVPPTKPKMSGNIQIIFYILLAGIVVALNCNVFELHEYIF